MEVIEHLQKQVFAFFTQVTSYIPLFYSSKLLIKVWTIEIDLSVGFRICYIGCAV